VIEPAEGRERPPLHLLRHVRVACVPDMAAEQEAGRLSVQRRGGREEVIQWWEFLFTAALGFLNGILWTLKYQKRQKKEAEK